MKKFTSILATILMVAALASPTFAASQNGTGTSGDQGIGHETGNQGNDKLVGNAGGGGIDLPGTNGCPGGDCSASGNFDIDVLALGGGLSADGVLIPNGAAGGIGAAGAIAGGSANGWFKEYEVPVYDWTWHPTGCWGFCGYWTKDLIGYETITAGGASADLSVWAGGVTRTEAYVFNPGFDVGIGVGSYTDNYATLGGRLEGDAWGLAYSSAHLCGLGGQVSLDGSILGPSPYFGWESDGMTMGLAGQGSVGGFVMGGVAAGYGDYEAYANIDMSGYSYSESYRGIDWFDGGKTEYMGSNVGAGTQVLSYAYDRDCGIGAAFVEGGFVAGGFAASKTVQATDTGFAAATAIGVYGGAGGLGCDFNGSAVGYTATSATTLNGYNGSIMSSSAGMNVSNGVAITRNAN